MDKRLLILSAITGFGLIFLSFPNGALSVLVVLAISVPAVFFIRKYSNEKDLLTNIFLLGLVLRIGLGIFIHVFDLIDLFGPDAITYNNLGQRLREIWLGIPVPDDSRTLRVMNQRDPGWGMVNLVAGIYMIFGQSPLVAQSFCAVFGALTAPMVYFCSEKIFNNKKVATISALAVAIFPSFIIWSAQLLKDGLIIFLLVCVMTAILQLQKKFNYFIVLLLILSVFGIFALRFYIFYMVAISVVGSFFIGTETSIQSSIRNILIILVLGLALTYLGVIRNASSNLESFGNLERVQLSRQDLATSADSGFGEDMDVSTPVGAISAVPIGLIYLFFAPFPWQATKLSQIVILPETLIWWALLPIMISGLWYTLKYKLRNAIPILLFSLMLTLSYSIFQGNVGMLYRQRTQIQVFLFMFIAVGWTLIQERRENKNLMNKARLQEIRKRLQSQKIEG